MKSVSTTSTEITLRVADALAEIERAAWDACANPQADALIAGVRQAGFTALADDLGTVDKKSSFTAFGAVLDWHNIVVQAEDTKTKLGGYPADTSASRVGRFAVQPSPSAMVSPADSLMIWTMRA